jgi:hypothetical protein
VHGQKKYIGRPTWPDAKSQQKIKTIKSNNNAKKSCDVIFWGSQAGMLVNSRDTAQQVYGKDGASRTSNEVYLLHVLALVGICFPLPQSRCRSCPYLGVHLQDNIR